MLTRSKDSQTDKAKRTMQDVVRYAQQVARDEGLRADVSAALAHGSKASDQLKGHPGGRQSTRGWRPTRTSEAPPSHARRSRCSERSCAEEEPSPSQLRADARGIRSSRSRTPEDSAVAYEAHRGLHQRAGLVDLSDGGRSARYGGERNRHAALTASRRRTVVGSPSTCFPGFGCLSSRVRDGLA